MKATEVVRCHGHPHVQGTHPTTFEVTTAEQLSLWGNCIIGVGADKGAADLDPLFSRLLQDDRALLFTTLRAGMCDICVSSRGNARLTLTHPHDLVWRKSSFADSRTVGIFSDQVAVTLPRELIRLLQEGKDLIVEMTVVIPG
ncbi:MAG: DUF371 domain-containing protein [Methanomicrobiales archaeon]|nr:DUF371 domain-containing protein [Methanomicrobiales archaeon]